MPISSSILRQILPQTSSQTKGNSRVFSRGARETREKQNGAAPNLEHLEHLEYRVGITPHQNPLCFPPGNFRRKRKVLGTWSTWSAVINLTSRAGELRSAPSGPDEWYRVAGKRALALGGARSQGKGREVIRFSERAPRFGFPLAAERPLCSELIETRRTCTRRTQKLPLRHFVTQDPPPPARSPRCHPPPGGLPSPLRLSAFPPARRPLVLPRSRGPPPPLLLPRLRPRRRLVLSPKSC